MLELLRKKDLHPKVGVAKSTVADWIEDFNIYIPKIKQGNRIFYRPEAIDVLLFIKQCREKYYQKQQIFELLAEKGFPVTVEEAVEDVKNTLNDNNDGNYRDTLMTMMQTTGQAVAEIADQKERLDEQDKTLERLGNRQEGQDDRIENVEKRTVETDETISYLKQEIESLKQELAATKEKEKKGFFARLFRK